LERVLAWEDDIKGFVKMGLAACDCVRDEGATGEETLAFRVCAKGVDSGAALIRDKGPPDGAALVLEGVASG